MRAVVIYESMYGNTHEIANAIARGLGPGTEVAVVCVAEAVPELLAGAGLVVAGGPTHLHGMSGARSRRAAADEARKDGSKLTLDAHAEGPGLRDWFGTIGRIRGWGAPPQSFLVTKDNRLRPGEEDRAEQWGRELAARLPAVAASP